jgi:3'-phosphoadenosine 5'-phosphosulfate sulfotransferase (PAPS reductase)/FAD synthetase
VGHDPRASGGGARVNTSTSDSEPELTVLSFGGGQDSTAILYRLIFDPVARARFAPHRLIVIMADTEDEHAATVAHVAQISRICAEFDIEFYLVGEAWRRKSWGAGGLRGFMQRTSTLMLKGQRKTCTDQLKIQPIYKFLDDYVSRTFGFTGIFKKALVRFAQSRGRVRVLVGIARGEERRIQDPDAKTKKGTFVLPPWQRASCRTVYPLLDWGWDRADCQDYISQMGFPVPPPSNCRICPYMSPVELVWLDRFDRPSFDAWVAMEEAKLSKFAAVCAETGKENRTVWGKKKLPEVLADALTQYGHWTDEQLNEYKMSHGHCVASKY